MMFRILTAMLLAIALSLAGCGTPLAQRSPPLSDLEYGSAAVQEPDDEAERQRLPVGCFSGLTLTQHVAGSLDDALNGDQQTIPVQVVAVAEHSPADLAGLRPLDVLVAAQIADQPRLEITHPGLWLQVEQKSKPGTEVSLWYTRLGEPKTTTLTLTKRARPGKRIPIRALTEDRRIGVCVRTLTEVESRRLDLVPGYGVVVLGLAHASPWRAAGIQLGDVVTALDDRTVSQPEDLIRHVQQDNRQQITVSIRRGDQTSQVECPLTTRETAVTESSLFAVWSYSYSPSTGVRSWSGPLWLIGYESTPSAWRMSLFWIIRFGGGERAALKAVQP